MKEDFICASLTILCMIPPMALVLHFWEHSGYDYSSLVVMELNKWGSAYIYEVLTMCVQTPVPEEIKM